ncbi:DNA translocase FtsK [Aliiglaciecola litoralis]|uniref:DNA translocase FtsK n=2 Tax=Aliiglaciecola litoralis TaxID=582857 RepID=A0ABN1LC46_9ALTE
MEVGMIISCAFAFFILLALASFNAADPSWSQAGFQGSIYNWVGPMGAWFADVLFFSFGRFAYVLPFLIAFTGWFLFQTSKKLDDIDYLTIGLRIIGSILFLVGISGLLSINFDDIFHFSAGGMMGDIVSSSLIPHFSLVGTTLLLLCFLLTGITLVSGISLLTVVDKIGELGIAAGILVYKAPKRIQQSPIARLGFKPSSERQSTDVEITTFKAVDQQSQRAQEPSFDIPDEVFDKQEQPSKPSILSVSELKNKIIGKKQPEAVAQKEPVEPVFSQTDTAQPPTYKVETKRVDEKDQQTQDPSQGPLPSFELLDRADKVKNPITQEELDGVSRLVEEKLLDFNIEAKVVGVYPGPVITRFELDLAPGVKVSRITGLAKDLARAMSALSVRVVEVIPGKSVIGLELPNKNREMVRLSEVIECQAFQGNDSALTMVLGADISGKPVVVDLAKMPHLLVAGTTGSGKSVGVNVMILSLLYKSSPEDVRMIMIDPKMLELSVYEGIPHLLAEVVTDMKEAANALRWCVGEMERRYRLMSALGVRNLKGYNAKVKKAIAEGNPIKDPLWRFEESMETVAPDLEKLPAIVVVVDEFADMMMIVGKKVEELIARIAQKARAAGIHLVLATQRPSVDVITGLIKANIPTRIAFQVSSKIDSRTILDQQGAESLLGMGDMLYLPPGTGVPTRVHGAFVDDHEVHAVVADWKKRGEPDYIEEILSGDSGSEVLLPGEQPEGGDQEYDAFYDEAVSFVTESRRASVSSVQRKFRIGYNRAARLVEQMEQSGVVSAAGHNGTREVLAPPPPKD